MTTAYTSLLGLALPVTGELSGTWGDTVNNAITSLLDTAVAGTTTLSTDADVTLTTTTGASNQARQAIILWTASGTVTRNITAPAQSKIYTVINNSGSTQSIVIRGAGPTTGVTVPKGKAIQVVWNGSDFVELSPNSITGNLTVGGNLTVNGNTTLGDAAADTVTVNGTITSNLIFTDNTYDIGASGATRPRTLYLGSNASIAGYASIGTPTLDSGNRLSIATSNTVGIFIAGNTSSHTKQDVYVTRASAGSTIQTGPNVTISNTSTNGSYALQVMNDDTLAVWSYLRGAWANIASFNGYGMSLTGASTTNGTAPLNITATGSSGIGIAMDGGGVNVKPCLIQFQQQSNGYWRIGMPQNANRMAIYGYVGATYPELFTFMEGSSNLGTLGIGTGSSTNGSYSIDIAAQNSLAINMSRSGGTGIRLNDSVTNSWDIYNVSNQLQFVRGGTLGWYFNSGRTFVRTATADDTFLSIQSSYSGNPEIIRLAQSGSDGYMLIKSAGGDTTQLAAYSGTLSYFAKSKLAVGSTSTNGARLYSLAASTEAALHTSTGPTANTSVWTMTGSGGTGDGVKWADVDIGGQGNGGSYFEWARGGSYDNWLNLYMRQGGSTSSANRFQFYNDGQAYKSSGAGSWGALSDIRIKTNVETVTGGLGRIMQLRPVTFDYKSPSAHNDKVHDKGFIADDYMLVYPNSVRECEFIHDDDKQHLNGGKPKALSFEAEFYADLVDAIQTLKNEFDAYKASHP